MIEERIDFLLDHKLLNKRNDKIVCSNHFKHYWDKFDKKYDIEWYCGDNIKEKIFRFLNDDISEHTCLWCGQKTKYKSLNKGFDDYCSQQCVRYHVKAQGIFTSSGYKHSKETRKMMSNNHARLSGDDNPFRKACLKDPSKAKEVSERKKAWWNNLSSKEIDEICEKFSLGQAKIINKCNHKNHKSGYFYSKKCGKKFYYRSSWEEKVCIILENNDRFDLFSLEEFYVEYLRKGKKRFTRIDFFVNIGDRRILLEVKPKSMIMIKNNLEKINGLQKYCINNDIEFYLITEDRINDEFFDLIIKGEIINDNFTKFE